jgi:predicted flap endonuclease-1-like 5' DNA nuclease
VNVKDVEGIGPVYAEKLAGAGVTTTDALLERGARPKGRAALADETGISPKLILEWVNHADLMRVNGVGSQYADLLSLAGVDSPLELARRNPGNLAGTFAEIDAARPGEVRRVPSEETVTDWIEQAKSLPRAVFHEDGPAAGADEAPAEPARETEPATRAAAPAPAAKPEPPAEAEPAPKAEPATRPASSPRPRDPTPVSAAKPTGLWGRIKRLIRLG